MDNLFRDISEKLKTETDTDDGIRKTEDQYRLQKSADIRPSH